LLGQRACGVLGSPASSIELDLVTLLSSTQTKWHSKWAGETPAVPVISLRKIS
jgi:hypothetical protein